VREKAGAPPAPRTPPPSARSPAHAVPARRRTPPGPVPPPRAQRPPRPPPGDGAGLGSGPAVKAALAPEREAPAIRLELPPNPLRPGVSAPPVAAPPPPQPDPAQMPDAAGARGGPSGHPDKGADAPPGASEQQSGPPPLPAMPVVDRRPVQPPPIPGPQLRSRSPPDFSKLPPAIAESLAKLAGTYAPRPGASAATPQGEQPAADGPPPPPLPTGTGQEPPPG
jgi:hypothetical protein